MTRAWDPDRYLPDPARRGEDHHCPCPEGCRDCEWTCPGKGCVNDPKNDPEDTREYPCDSDGCEGDYECKYCGCIMQDNPDCPPDEDEE